MYGAAHPVGPAAVAPSRPINAGTVQRDLYVLCAALWLVSLAAIAPLLLLRPSFFATPTAPYPAAFNDEPSVAGPLYHFHPEPTKPIWSWCNHLNEYRDDFIRLTLHCDEHVSCHLEVESFRIH